MRTMTTAKPPATESVPSTASAPKEEEAEMDIGLELENTV